MTPEEWIDKAKRDKDLLLQLVREFHPVYLARKGYTVGLRITAPTAEAMRRSMLPVMAKNGIDPVEQFEKALESGNIDSLVSILNKAWFGVPESTDCWAMPGFREACNLLEEPPDEPATR